MDQLVELIKLFGPAGGVLAVVAWWLQNRIKASDTRGEKTEDFIRSTLLSSLQNNTTAIQKLNDNLEDRPCLIESKERKAEAIR